MNIFKRKIAHLNAFTLAEVLTTLSILGVVAAIMIPSTVQKFQDRIQITGMKRAYSMLENALQQMYAIEGDPRTYDWPDPSDASNNRQNGNYFGSKLANYLPVQKYCGSSEGCMPTAKDIDSFDSSGKVTYLTLTGAKGQYSAYTDHLVFGKMILKNNMMLSVNILDHDNSDKRSIGVFRVDINGKQKPNRYGYDVFFFTFDEKGLQSNKPGDWRLYINSGGDYKNACSKNTVHYRSGMSCSFWIMKHNNMDYKYRDVSSEW